MASARARVHIGLAHGHDLALQAHFHAAKGHVGGVAFFPLQRSTSRQRADMRQHRVDPLAATCDGAVDPFARQQ